MLHCPGWAWHHWYSLRRHVLRLSEIGRALIERCVEITDINANPVRCASVVVAGVVGSSGFDRKRSSERIDPGA